MVELKLLVFWIVSVPCLIFYRTKNTLTSLYLSPKWRPVYFALDLPLQSLGFISFSFNFFCQFLIVILLLLHLVFFFYRFLFLLFSSTPSQRVAHSTSGYFVFSKARSLFFSSSHTILWARHRALNAWQLTAEILVANVEHKKENKKQMR